MKDIKPIDNPLDSLSEDELSKIMPLIALCLFLNCVDILKKYIFSG